MLYNRTIKTTYAGWDSMYTYKPKTNHRKTFFYIALLSLIPFLIIGYIGHNDWSSVTALDYEIGAEFYALREPLRTTIATGITRIGDRQGQTYITIAIVIILFFARKWRTALWYGLTVLIGADFLNSFTKDIFQRIRPDQIEHLVVQDGYAYPSGHAMGSIILFGGLLFLIIRYMNASRNNLPIVKWAVSIFLLLLILAIGLSRIYLGVHYPSDVVGGYWLGLAWLCLSIGLLGYPLTEKEFKRKRKYQFKTK